MRFSTAGLTRGPASRVALLVLSCAACQPAVATVHVRDLTIATGPQGGAFHTLAVDVARHLNGRLADLRILPRAAGGSTSNVSSVERSTDDCAFARADVAYAAYTHGTRLHRAPHTRLRAIAVMHRSVLHVVTSAGSRIRSLEGIRGTRVIYGRTAEDGEDAPVRLIDLLEAGVDLKEQDVHASVATFDDAAHALAVAATDVSLLRAGYPMPAVQRLAANNPIRLLDISPAVATKIRAQYPFYKPAIIPAETYEGQLESVSTVGVDNLLVCQRDLDEGMVHQVTRALFESLPTLAAVNFTAGQIDPDLAPTTPIPLHSGASRYYRERELFR